MNAFVCSAQISNPTSPAFKPDKFYQKQMELQQRRNAPTIPRNRGITADDLKNQSRQHAMRQMGYNPPVIPTQNNPFPNTQMPQSSQRNESNSILKELESDRERNYYLSQKQESDRIKTSYKIVYDEVLKMFRNEIPFSLKKAVFMIENVYCDNTLNYDEFNKMIQSRLEGFDYLLKKENINTTSDLGKNYLIQKQFADTITYQDVKKSAKVLYPFTYDFEDYAGYTDWKKMFVSKLLQTGKGQCHSLPLLYLILAEETKTKAWLTLAPEHSFIQFRDKATNKWYNYETTNGNVVSTSWIIESGYITSEAIKNKIYLDTLGKEGLISILLADLTMGYIDKNGYDDFVFKMIENLESVYKNNIQSYLLKADIMTLYTQSMASKYNNPPIEKIDSFPELAKQVRELYKLYDKIDNLGYIKMPDEMYQKWLASLNNEKSKIEKSK